MSKRPNKLRVMAEGFEPRRTGWAVASGDVGKPSRGCFWGIIAIYDTQADATARFDELEANANIGRALLDLTNASLAWIGRDGKIMEPRAIPVTDDIYT